MAGSVAQMPSPIPSTVGDELTGLDGRLSFCRRLAQSSDGSGTRLLMIVDIDGFVNFNHVHGSGNADQLLCHIADRLTGHSSVVGRPARLDGDRFGMILEADGANAALELAHLLLADLKRPYRIGEELHILSMTGGCCILSIDSDGPRALLHAEVALYRAHQSAPGSMEVFTRSDEETMQRENTLRTSLKRAIALEEFQLVYQPIFDLLTGKMRKVEALIRWRNDGKWVSPIEFVTLAEREGLIQMIGDWVIRTACCAARQLPDDVKVHVNVSPKQLEAGWINTSVQAALEVSRIAPSRLVLEITEQVMIADRDEVRRDLQALRDIGLQIALDDFGTGYSALSYLADYPLDIIKIDRSLLTRSREFDTALIVLRSSIRLARDLGLETTVEGVECAEEANLCADLGADTAQGYFFARPSAMEDVCAAFDLQHALDAETTGQSGRAQ